MPKPCTLHPKPPLPRALALLKDCPPELMGGEGGGEAKNYKIVYTSRREVYEVQAEAFTALAL